MQNCIACILEFIAYMWPIRIEEQKLTFCIYLQICFVKKFFLTHSNICKVITINYICLQYIRRCQ